MKAFVLMFYFLTCNAPNVWANNLLLYIQMPVKSQFFITFSSQGVQFKECAACSVIRLKPSAKVAFFEHNSPIKLQQATELFIGKKHSHVSIFYNRHTRIYDKIVFGRFIEEEKPEPNL